MTRLENFALGVAKTIAQLKGSELSYRITEHSIDTSFVKPQNTDSRVWEDNYNEGCIYIGNYANPVEITIPENENEDYNLVTTQKYKTIMKQDAIREAFNTEGTGLDFTTKMIIGNIIITFMIAILIVGTQA